MRNLQRVATVRRNKRVNDITEIGKEIDTLGRVLQDSKSDKTSGIQSYRDSYNMLRNKIAKLCQQRAKEKRKILLNNIKKDGKALHKPLADKEKPQVGAIKKENKLITNKKEIAEVIANRVSRTYVDNKGDEQNIMKENYDKGPH